MLKLLIPLSSIFFLSGPALADFGSADTSGSKGNEVSTFKAKCGEEQKACNIKIDFEGGKVIVDKTNYVERNRIKEVRYSRQERRCVLGNNNCLMPVQQSKFTTDISYQKTDGSIGTARVIFRELNAGSRFFDSMALLIGVQPENVNKEGSTGVVINKSGTKTFPDIPAWSLGVGLAGVLAITSSGFLFLKRKKN